MSGQQPPDFARSDSAPVETQPFTAGIATQHKGKSDEQDDSGHQPGLHWQGVASHFLAFA
jgi:hypothetical protein